MDRRRYSGRFLNDVEPARPARCAHTHGGRAHRVEAPGLQHAHVLSRGRRWPPNHDHPCRGASQLSETLKLIVPDPVPDCPPSRVIQDASGLAVQVQPCWVVIVAVRLYGADMQGVSSTGVTEDWQFGVSPACVTKNVRSPTAIAPVRLVTSRFLSTE